MLPSRAPVPPLPVRHHDAARARFLKCVLSFCHSPNRHGACTRHWKSKAESETNTVPALMGGHSPREGQMVTKEPRKLHKIVNTVSARKSHPGSCVFAVRSLSWCENQTSGLRRPTPTVYTGPFAFQDGVRCCSRLPRAPWGAPTLSATAPTVLFYNFPLSRLCPPTGR